MQARYPYQRLHCNVAVVLLQTSTYILINEFSNLDGHIMQPTLAIVTSQVRPAARFAVGSIAPEQALANLCRIILVCC